MLSPLQGNNKAKVNLAHCSSKGITVSTVTTVTGGSARDLPAGSDHELLVASATGASLPIHSLAQQPALLTVTLL